MRCEEVTDYLRTLCGVSIPGDDLGYLHGDGSADCTGVACLWMATTAALDRCCREKLNLVVVHEALLQGFQASRWYPDPPADAKAVNRTKIERLDRGRLNVFRVHSAWDNAPDGHGVPDACAAALGWTQLHAASEFCRVWRIEPTRLGWLAEQVGQAMARDLGHGPIRTRPRLFGDPRRMIERVGLAIGGFGGNQLHMPYHLAEMGAETIITGDLVEEFAIVAAELGLGVIGTLHSWTEEFAVAGQARLLREHFAGLRVMHWRTGVESFAPGPIADDAANA